MQRLILQGIEVTGAAARRWVAVLCACLASCLTATAFAAFPERAITVVVPYAPGGATDVLGRVIGQRMAESLGQSVVVENRPGASGVTGLTSAARAPADGYTIVFYAVSDAAIYAAASPNPVVHLLRNFSSVAGVADSPHILVVPASLPVQTVRELITMLKAAPGKYNFASNTWFSQVEGELFKIVTGTDMVHVPYKGGPQALLDLLQGHTTLMFLSSAAAVPHVKTGKLRILAVTSNRRLAMVPTVPTMEEAGVADFSARNLFGVYAPRGTPPAVIAVLSKAVADALAVPDVRQRLENQGLDVRYSPPAELDRMMDEDFRSYERVVRRAGMKIE